MNEQIQYVLKNTQAVQHRAEDMTADAKKQVRNAEKEERMREVYGTEQSI